jgi:hypothetical protein
MSSSSPAADRIAAGLALAAFGLAMPVIAQVDLAALKITPQRGQSADQLRRDRYECHNWAVEQTGVVPLAPSQNDESEQAGSDKRAERIARVLTGVAIGGAIGGLVRSTQGEDPSNGVLAGSAIGAAVGAATGRGGDEDGGADEPDDYLRALSACLEGRGYTVALPGGEDAEDNSSASSPRSPRPTASSPSAAVSAVSTTG